MEKTVVTVIADNIVSPLGATSAATYASVKAGRSQLCRYEGMWGMPEPAVLSLLPDDMIDSLAPEASQGELLTRFERMCIASAGQAIEKAGIDAASPQVVFVLSTTKGNVHLLDSRETRYPRQRVYLGEAARMVSRHFGNTNEPIVVSNACISGVCAQIVAMRLMECGNYDNAVVIGADMQSPFIVSGFQSFKALSPVECKPFDATRQGLNLGEAAATMVLGREGGNGWQLVHGAIRNDANHISGPSRTGEGSYRALTAALSDTASDELAFINAHGTATPYNDEMESIAIERAGLVDVPVNSLKGYFGHTMGAAGVLESIVSMRAIEDHTILPTRGFETLGVSRAVRVSNQLAATDRHAFIKLLSGFGGCNAALLYRKEARI